jgi:hypothetical protein
MPGHGVVPKLHPIRDRDGTRRQAEFTRLSPDDEIRGPELPASIEWPEQTVAMYESLRRDPIAQALTDADWHHVIDTMSLHRLLWSGEPSNQIKVAAEVRLRLGQLGITPEARLRLRMMIAPPGSDTPMLDDLRAKQRGMYPERKRRLMAAIDEPPKPAPKPKGKR